MRLSPPLVPELEEMSGLTARQIRMLRLGGIALQEVAEGLTNVAEIPVLLGTPEAFPNRPDPAGEDFFKHLSTQSEIVINISDSKIFPLGRAAGLIALKEGVDRIKSGQNTHVIVGGIDTYLDLYLLGTLDMEGRILAEGVMDGFIPGEGAGFLLLGSDQETHENQKPMAACCGGIRRLSVEKLFPEG